MLSKQDAPTTYTYEYGITPPSSIEIEEYIKENPHVRERRPVTRPEALEALSHALERKMKTLDEESLFGNRRGVPIEASDIDCDLFFSEYEQLVATNARESLLAELSDEGIVDYDLEDIVSEILDDAGEEVFQSADWYWNVIKNVMTTDVQEFTDTYPNVFMSADVRTVNRKANVAVVATRLDGSNVFFEFDGQWRVTTNVIGEGGGVGSTPRAAYQCLNCL